MVNGGTTPYQYNWNTGGNSAIENNLTSGNYNCIIQDASGCEINGTYQVSDYSGLVANFNATSYILDLNANEQFEGISTSSLGSDHVWNFGDGTFSNQINATHIYDSVGTYTVTLSVNNGVCSNSTTVEIEVVSSTGIESVDLDEITFSQNANSVQLTFGKTQYQQAEIELVNAQGKMISSKSIMIKKGGNHVINTTELAAALYFVRIKHAEETDVFRFIK